MSPHLRGLGKEGCKLALVDGVVTIVEEASVVEGGGGSNEVLVRHDASTAAHIRVLGVDERQQLLEHRLRHNAGNAATAAACEVNAATAEVRL